MMKRNPQPEVSQRSLKPLPKSIGYIGLALAVMAIIVWAFWPAPVLVNLGRVERSELQVTIDAEGKTRVRERFVIAAGVDGHLARITLHEGDAVAAGMVVAQIDPLPLTTFVQETLGKLAEWRAQRSGVTTQRPKVETINQARLRIQAAEAQQRQSEAKVAEARAALEQARRDRQRAQQLAADGAISRQEREVAELNETTKSKELEAVILAAKTDMANVKVARAALAVVQQEQTDPDYWLRVYDARIASTEAELSRVRDEAARTDIHAPVTGQVLRLHQQGAQFVTKGTALMDIGDPTQLELVIDVLSIDAPMIKPGQPILLVQRADQRLGTTPTKAKVRVVEPSAFTKVSALGVEEQRVNVIGDLIGASPALGDAYRVDTKIVIWRREDVLNVPISALFRCQQSNWCVFVVENGKAKQRSVQIGHRSDRNAEVQQGLRSGEQVILHPTEQIKQGTRVTAQSMPDLK